jgi:nucleoside-diphosphate-sugar epimerase
MMMKILVTGATGYFGNRLAAIAQSLNNETGRAYKFQTVIQQETFQNIFSQ